MKTKYVCRGLISPYVNFRNNRTMWSTNLREKFAGAGGESKKSRPLLRTKMQNGKQTEYNLCNSNRLLCKLHRKIRPHSQFFGSFPVFPPFKISSLCLIYVLLRLNA